MTSKRELQAVLKNRYGINKNITQSLSLEDCENLLLLLKSDPSAEKLVGSLIGKNNELAQKNRVYGLRRQQAEKRLERLRTEYGQIEQAIATLEKENETLKNRRGLLSDEQQALEAQVAQLAGQNQRLSSRVQTLIGENNQLVQANDQLKRDNKDLKNIVDQIRLRLTRDINMLLEYEDSELRKAMIRLFRWTLG